MKKMLNFSKNIKRTLWQLESNVHYVLASQLDPAPIPLPDLKVGDEQVVVSLTSFPERFDTLHIALKALLNQSVPADLIMLWIAETDHGSLPETILNLEERFPRFVIGICEDFMSYNKIIPTIESHPDATIVTADDDIIYSKNWLKTLLGSRTDGAPTIIAHRAHEILLDQAGRPSPYSSWHFCIKRVTNFKLTFPTGCGGALYPPRCFHKKITDADLFQELAPTADDVWLYWMARLADTPVKLSKIAPYNVVEIPNAHKHGLAALNVQDRKNDEQIQRMLEYFGPVW